MFDAIKNYLALANGVTEVTRQRALSAAKALVTSGEATAEQVTNLADDLVTTSRNNRDTVLALIRYEIDRALLRLGLATSEELAAIAERVDALEKLVKDRRATAAPEPVDKVPAKSASRSVKMPEPAASADPLAPPEPPAGAPARPTKRATKAARKAPAKRSPAKRSPAKRVVGGTSAGATSATASPRESPLAPPVQPAKAVKAAKAGKATKSAPAKRPTKAVKPVKAVDAETDLPPAAEESS